VSTIESPIIAIEYSDFGSVGIGIFVGVICCVGRGDGKGRLVGVRIVGVDVICVLSPSTVAADAAGAGTAVKIFLG